MSLHDALKMMIPPLTRSSHKGQSGRLLVIGGCSSYSGAPYFAAKSALSIGCDLATVISSCEPSASIPIKSYSPELMIRPELVPRWLINSKYISPHTQKLDSDNGDDDDEKFESTIQDMSQEDKVSHRLIRSISPLLSKMHSVVIGCGLGLDPSIHRQCYEIIETLAKQQQRHNQHQRQSESTNNALPLILDGDGIQLLISHPDILSSYPSNRLIITPNHGEFSRLWLKFVSNGDGAVSPLELTDELESYMKSHDDSHSSSKRAELPLDHPFVRDTVQLSSKMSNITIVRKGPIDIITDARVALACARQSGSKRCGGQGDICAGLTSSMAIWAFEYQQNQIAQSLESAESTRSQFKWSIFGSSKLKQLPYSPSLCAAFNACWLTRRSSYRAFQNKGRATGALDLIRYLEEHAAERNLYNRDQAYQQEFAIPN